VGDFPWVCVCVLAAQRLSEKKQKCRQCRLKETERVLKTAFMSFEIDLVINHNIGPISMLHISVLIIKQK